MAENLGLLNPYLVTGIGNTGAYTQPSQVGETFQTGELGLGLGFDIFFWAKTYFSFTS